MYCIACGQELKEGARICEECGAPVPNVREAKPAHASFEYARTVVDSDLVTVATDCYENLGWEITGVSKSPTSHCSTLSFRRSRKMKGKAQLVKIQRKMDDALCLIAELEKKKTSKATVQALAVGIVAALVLGVGMCCTMIWADTLMVVGIVVGILGIAGCIANYFLYCRSAAKETERVMPQIEAAYDGLATLCEEAQTIASV